MAKTAICDNFGLAQISWNGQIYNFGSEYARDFILVSIPRFWAMGNSLGPISDTSDWPKRPKCQVSLRTGLVPKGLPIPAKPGDLEGWSSYARPLCVKLSFVPIERAGIVGGHLVLVNFSWALWRHRWLLLLLLPLCQVTSSSLLVSTTQCLCQWQSTSAG